jgi:hypothetical protein
MPPNDKFDVYVEGVRDKSPQGVQRAAQALAPRLSMPADKVAKLLTGRFRVRTGVDEDMGRKLVGDLEAFGLRVVIVPQGAKPGPAPGPAPAKPAAPAAKPAAPPAPAARPMAQAPTLQASPPPAPIEDADGGISIGGLELMGNSTPAAEPPPPSRPAAPAALQPQGFMPSSFGPPPDDNQELDLAAPAPSPPPRTAAKAAPPPADPFAPPDAPSDHGIDLDVSGPKARTTQPPAAAKRSGTTIPPQASVTSSQRMSALKMKQKVGEARARALRGGLIVLVLAVAAGYFPGHLYAKHVDETKVVELQKEYRQLEVNPWKGEATHRTTEKVRDEIREIRWNAMLLMIGIWAACSGLLAALAYVLF